MNLRMIWTGALCLALATGFTACGRMASSAPADKYLKGEVNDGNDLNDGVNNETQGEADQNHGVINPDHPANVNGTPVTGTPMRKPDGTCVNNTDADLAALGHDVVADDLCNEEDDDIDGDGVPNHLDDDMDGDGIPNHLDDDIDGDGIPNIHDNDIDGDGIANVNDDDMDGDGIPNSMDDDMDGDGIRNIDDNDIDGDGIPNDKDDDIDGDGIPNHLDDDIDGDGIPNETDNDINGDGIPDNDGQTDAEGSRKEVYFTKKGSVTLSVVAGADGGAGQDYLNLRDMRDSARAKNADTSTITPLNIKVNADLAASDVLQTHGNMGYSARIYYQLPGSEPVLIAMTPVSATNPVSGLASGISFDDSTLLPTKFFGSFQKLCATSNSQKILMRVELQLDGPAPVSMDLPLYYEVTASAKARI